MHNLRNDNLVKLLQMLVMQNNQQTGAPIQLLMQTAAWRTHKSNAGNERNQPQKTGQC